MTNSQEGYFPSANGVNEVFYRRWLPQGRPLAQLQILHGLSEHSLRYESFARYLNQAGFVVVAHDHIGHGYSFKEGQPKGYFADHDGWQCVLRDVQQMQKLQRQQYPDLPYFMFGHSMGSFALRHYLLQYPADLGGVIFSGTGQISTGLLHLGGLLTKLECRRIGPRGLSKWLQYIAMGSYNKGIHPHRTLVDWISRDDAAVDAYLADPLCRILPTVGMYADMFEGISVIGNTAEFHKLNPDLPVLFISGAADPVGGYGKQVRWLYQAFAQAGLRDLTLKLYPGGRHEMLNELNKQEVYDDIRAWLLQ